MHERAGDRGKIDLSYTLRGLVFDPAIMNASGFLCYPSVLKRYESCLGGLVTKSTGIKEKEGNETPIVACSGQGWINAVGLPNPGIRGMAEELKELYPFRVPLILSVFANTVEEIPELIGRSYGCCDAYELNVSCPNIKEGETTGIAIGMDHGLVGDFTRAAVEQAKERGGKPVIVKLTPALYIADDIRKTRTLKTAQAAVEAGAAALACINTVPGGMVIDIYAREPVLSARYGGMSGPGIRPIGVGMTYAIHEAFPDIPIIGCGGIETPEHAVEYVEAGASAVQIGSALFSREGTLEKTGFIDGFTRELAALCERLGVAELSELRGAAHGRRHQARA